VAIPGHKVCKERVNHFPKFQGEFDQNGEAVTGESRSFAMSTAGPAAAAAAAIGLYRRPIADWMCAWRRGRIQVGMGRWMANVLADYNKTSLNLGTSRSSVAIPGHNRLLALLSQNLMDQSTPKFQDW